MPVIRGQVRGTVLPDDLRKTLIEKIQNERAGTPSSSGKTAFESSPNI